MKRAFYLASLINIFIPASDTQFVPISLDPIDREWEFVSVVLKNSIKKYSNNTENMRICPCIHLDTRIAFAREIIRELMIRQPQTEVLHYTSFASASLLQDYIIILGLVMIGGYRNFDIHCIDLFYEEEIVTKKIVAQFIKQFNEDIKKSLEPIAAHIKIYTHKNANSYFEHNPIKPDIIVFADPDMNKFTKYDPQISKSGIIDIPSIQAKWILRDNHHKSFYISEKVDATQDQVKNFCRNLQNQNSIETAVDLLKNTNQFYLATNHQFLSFDEFLRNSYFNGTNPLVALLHNDFATALTSSRASAYLMTRQDYLQHDYTLQALSFSGFKQLPCETD